MVRLKSMRYLLFLLPFVLSACDLFGGSAPQPEPAKVTLSASSTEGERPLTVTFHAAASPVTDIFSWAIGSELQSETSSTFTTTFERSGLYVVSVSAGGASANSASDSVAVTVTAPDLPPTGPDIGKLKLTPTPGGPAPWAVRYTVKAAVEPGLPPGLEYRCSETRSYRQLVGDSFSCVHNAPDTVGVRVVIAGTTTATAQTVAKITQNEGVAFAGRWRYTSRGVTETFEITRGSETVGQSADGRFKLFTVGQRGGLVVEFTIDGRTVVLTPTPGDAGEQRYEGLVYGLVLEPLPKKP